MKRLLCSLLCSLSFPALAVLPEVQHFIDRPAYVFGIYFFSGGASFIYHVEVNEGSGWFRVASFTDAPRGMPLVTYTNYGGDGFISFPMGMARVVVEDQKAIRVARGNSPAPWIRWRPFAPVRF